MYSSYKIYGPYTRKADGRQHVIIYKNKQCTTLSYPRFVMENYLGRYLLPEEDVHHIDGNVTNNDLSNLEVKTTYLHRREHALKYLKPVQAICLWCKKYMVLSTTRQSQLHRDAKRGKVGPFCSKRCIGQYGKHVQMKNKQ